MLVREQHRGLERCLTLAGMSITSAALLLERVRINQNKGCRRRLQTRDCSFEGLNLDLQLFARLNAIVQLKSVCVALLGHIGKLGELLAQFELALARYIGELCGDRVELSLQVD
jgi:hypothetical protein